MSQGTLRDRGQIEACVSAAEVSVNLNDSVADAFGLAATPGVFPDDFGLSGSGGGAGDRALLAAAEGARAGGEQQFRPPLGSPKRAAAATSAAAPSLSSYFGGGAVASDDAGGAASFFESFASPVNPASTTDPLAADGSRDGRGDEGATPDGGARVPEASGIASYFAVADARDAAFDSIAPVVLPPSPPATTDSGRSSCCTAIPARDSASDCDAAPRFDVERRGETLSQDRPQPTQQPEPMPQGGSQQRPPQRQVDSAPPTVGEAGLPFGVDDDGEANPFLVAERSAERDDRAYDAWIPCARTQRTLMQLLTSAAPGAASVGAPPDQLTMPGLLTSESPTDSVLQLLYRLKLDTDIAKRQRFYVDEFSYDLAGLRVLVEAQSWLQCLELTGHLLTLAGQGLNKAGTPSKHTPDTLKVWAIRLAVMVKLKMFAAAEGECQTFGDLDGPDLYYEYYPQLCPGRKGSMVPFGMRLLRAQLPQLAGNSGHSLDRLLQLRAVISKILSNLRNGLTEDGGVIMISNESLNASIELWCKRELMTLYSLANCLGDMKDIALAVKVYEEIASKDKVNAPAAYTSIGRLLLQTGDINSARTYFHKAHVLESNPAKKRFNEALNRGYLALASGESVEACRCFKEAAEVASDDPRARALALNNMAVGQVYSRRLSEAVSGLESCMRTDPQRFVNDSALLNLSTLYDLATPNAFHKKIGILQLANEHKAHSFSVSSFKLV